MDIEGLIPLDPDSLINVAKRNTGLDYFGEDGRVLAAIAVVNFISPVEPERLEKRSLAYDLLRT